MEFVGGAELPGRTVGQQGFEMALGALAHFQCLLVEAPDALGLFAAQVALVALHAAQLAGPGNTESGGGALVGLKLRQLSAPSCLLSDSGLAPW